jgi:hypothetical protein
MKSILRWPGAAAMSAILTALLIGKEHSFAKININWKASDGRSMPIRSILGCPELPELSGHVIYDLALSALRDLHRKRKRFLFWEAIPIDVNVGAGSWLGAELKWVCSCFRRSHGSRVQCGRRSTHGESPTLKMRGVSYV